MEGKRKDLERFCLPQKEQRGRDVQTCGASPRLARVTLLCSGHSPRALFTCFSVSCISFRLGPHKVALFLIPSEAREREGDCRSVCRLRVGPRGSGQAGGGPGPGRAAAGAAARRLFWARGPPRPHPSLSARRRPGGPSEGQQRPSPSAARAPSCLCLAPSSPTGAFLPMTSQP